MIQVMGNSVVSKSRRHLSELSTTSFGQRGFQSALRDRSDAESGISSPSYNHSSSYSPTRDLLTAEPAVCNNPYSVTINITVGDVRSCEVAATVMSLALTSINMSLQYLPYCSNLVHNAFPVTSVAGAFVCACHTN